MNILIFLRKCVIGSLLSNTRISVGQDTKREKSKIIDYQKDSQEIDWIDTIFITPFYPVILSKRRNAF